MKKLNSLSKVLHEIKLSENSISNSTKRNYLAYVNGVTLYEVATELHIAIACKSENLKPKTLANKFSIISGATKKYPKLDLQKFTSFNELAKAKKLLKNKEATISDKGTIQKDAVAIAENNKTAKTEAENSKTQIENMPTFKAFIKEAKNLDLDAIEIYKLMKNLLDKK